MDRSYAAGPGRPVVQAAADQARTLLEAGRLLLASDFDGTLARLVTDPWGATIIPAAQRALRRLATSPHVHVALLSGRTVHDLAGRARIGGIRYLGDHGAEWADAPRGFRPAALRVQREPAGPAELAAAERLRAEVPRAIPEAWLVVEAKGAALTFHFRGAPDIDSARARIVAATDALDPDEVLLRSGGRRSLELRPRGAADKGAALARLIDERRPRAVIMLGDDHSDALAFDALRSARAEGRILGLAIAVAGHADVSAQVAPRADLVLASPDEAARFLGRLASRAAPVRSARGRPPRPRSSRGSLR
jgi:trehalose 6-phosphate phosphatase